MDGIISYTVPHFPAISHQCAPLKSTPDLQFSLLDAVDCLASDFPFFVRSYHQDRYR